MKQDFFIWRCSTCPLVVPGDIISESTSDADISTVGIPVQESTHLSLNDLPARTAPVPPTGDLVDSDSTKNDEVSEASTLRRPRDDCSDDDLEPPRQRARNESYTTQASDNETAI